MWRHCNQGVHHWHMSDSLVREQAGRWRAFSLRLADSEMLHPPLLTPESSLYPPQHSTCCLLQEGTACLHASRHQARSSTDIAGLHACNTQHATHSWSSHGSWWTVCAERAPPQTFQGQSRAIVQAQPQSCMRLPLILLTALQTCLTEVPRKTRLRGVAIARPPQPAELNLKDRDNPAHLELGQLGGCMLLHGRNEGLRVAHRLGGHDGGCHNLAVLVIGRSKGHRLSHIRVGEQGPIHLQQGRSARPFAAGARAARLLCGLK